MGGSPCRYFRFQSRSEALLQQEYRKKRTPKDKKDHAGAEHGIGVQHDHLIEAYRDRIQERDYEHGEDTGMGDHCPEGVQKPCMFRGGIENIRACHNNADPGNADEGRDLMEHQCRSHEKKERRKREHWHRKREVCGLQRPERKRGTDNIDCTRGGNGNKEVRAEGWSASDKGNSQQKKRCTEKTGCCQQVRFHRLQELLVHDIVCSIRTCTRTGKKCPEHGRSYLDIIRS